MTARARVASCTRAALLPCGASMRLTCVDLQVHMETKQPRGLDRSLAPDCRSESINVDLVDVQSLGWLKECYRCSVKLTIRRNKQKKPIHNFHLCRTHCAGLGDGVVMSTTAAFWSIGRSQRDRYGHTRRRTHHPTGWTIDSGVVWVDAALSSRGPILQGGTY
jgi:hypothetical protein